LQAANTGILLFKSDTTTGGFEGIDTQKNADGTYQTETANCGD